MIASIARIKIIKEDFGESLNKQEQFDYHIVAILDDGSRESIPGTYRSIGVAFEYARSLSRRARKERGKRVPVCGTPEIVKAEMTGGKVNHIKNREQERFFKLQEKTRQKRIDNQR